MPHYTVDRLAKHHRRAEREPKRVYYLCLRVHEEPVLLYKLLSLLLVARGVFVAG